MLKKFKLKKGAKDSSTEDFNEHLMNFKQFEANMKAD